jgi:hypothetical protein
LQAEWGVITECVTNFNGRGSGSLSDHGGDALVAYIAIFFGSVEQEGSFK